MKKIKKQALKKKNQDVNIKTISFSRLINTGNYENVRIEATIEIAEGENCNKSYSALKSWVDEKAEKIRDEDSL